MLKLKYIKNYNKIIINTRDVCNVKDDRDSQLL